MKYSYITIEGNIGAGKTSLAKMLAGRYNGKLILEQFADNPFLPKFYENQQQFAFALELFFLAERQQQIKQNLSGQDLFRKVSITDYLFIKSLLFAKINLQEEEYKLYSRFFHLIYPSLPQPELLVYLHCPVDKLMEQIKNRGRDYEQKIKPEYLLQIQQSYFDFFRTQPDWKILVVDVSGVNFVQDEKHFARIIELLDKDYKAGTHFISTDK